MAIRHLMYKKKCQSFVRFVGNADCLMFSQFTMSPPSVKHIAEREARGQQTKKGKKTLRDGTVRGNSISRAIRSRVMLSLFEATCACAVLMSLTPPHMRQARYLPRISSPEHARVDVTDQVSRLRFLRRCDRRAFRTFAC